LVDCAARLAGRPVTVSDGGFSGSHSATVSISPRDGAPHAIRYKPSQRAYRDHFIAHEAAHLIRFYSAQPEDQVVATSNVGHRRAAAESMQGHLVRQYVSGLPEGALGELLSMWHSGVVTQITNYPADFRIERWLHEEYPMLDDAQRASLRDQLRDNEKVLRSPVRRFTPRLVFDACAAMNAGLARYLSLMYEDSRLAGRYAYSEFWKRGCDLADSVWSTPNRGYTGDVETSKGWSRLFGLDGWYEWKHIDEVRLAEAQ
jgi:hypothetical protein